MEYRTKSTRTDVLFPPYGPVLLPLICTLVQQKEQYFAPIQVERVIHESFLLFGDIIIYYRIVIINCRGDNPVIISSVTNQYKVAMYA